jgi:hypothetical protein
MTRLAGWAAIVLIAATACGGVAGVGVIIGIDPTPIPQASYPRVIRFSRGDDSFTVTVALEAAPYTSLVAIEAGDGSGGRYKGSSYQGIAPHVPWSFKYAQEITVEMLAAVPLDSLVVTGERGQSFQPLQFTLYPELEEGVPGLKPLEASVMELNGRLPFFLEVEDLAHLTRVLAVRRVDGTHGEETNSQRRAPLQSYVTLDVYHTGPGTMTVALLSAYAQYSNGTLVELPGIDTAASSPISCASEEGESPACKYTIQGDNTLSVSVWIHELDPDAVALIIPVLVNQQQPSEVLRRLVLPIAEDEPEADVDPESD